MQEPEEAELRIKLPPLDKLKKKNGRLKQKVRNAFVKK